MKPKNVTKEEMIEYAASRGIKLTVIDDDPSEKIYFPEKVELANKMLSRTRFTNIKELSHLNPHLK